MAFWNFSHNVLHMHVYLLPSIVAAATMLITGLVHKKKQKDREEEFNKELRGETPEAPEA